MEFRGFRHHEIIQNESPIIQYLTTCRASIFGVRTCPGVSRFSVTTPPSVLLPYLACGCRSTAITTQTKAASVTMALAAFEYSHWLRNSFQFLGTTVQLLVA